MAHKTADILVDAMGNVINEANANRVTNDEGTELFGRAAEKHANAGEREERPSDYTARRNQEAREAAERWAAMHAPVGAELETEPAPDFNFNAEGGVAADTIQSPGIIIDKYTGKTWTLPTDAMADMSALLHHSPYNIKKDPNFHYEFHSLSEFNSMLSQDFVPVTCKELGIPENIRLPGQTASPLDRYYIVEGMDICMKTPKVLGQARLDTLSKFSRAAVNGTRKGQITMANAENLRDTPSTLPTNDPDVPVSGGLNIRTDRHAPTRDEME